VKQCTDEIQKLSCKLLLDALFNPKNSPRYVLWWSMDLLWELTALPRLPVWIYRERVGKEEKKRGK